MSVWGWMIPTVLAAGSAGGFFRSKYERNHFVVEETIIVSEKIRQERTLVFLSDLHDKEFGDKNRSLIGAIAAVNPDRILVGGDTMVAKRGKASLLSTKHLLCGLTKLAPVYYGNGNHEQRLQKDTGDYGDTYERLLMLFAQYGVTYLQNASVDVGDDITISGLDIEKNYYKDVTPSPMERSYVTRKLGAVSDPGRFQILLAHSPLFLDAYAGWGADLTLSGHFHGGTIRIPFLGGVMTPQFQFFLPWCAGNFEKDGHHMLVSRGLGTHSINIRVGNKPQVIVVKLKPK